MGDSLLGGLPPELFLLIMAYLRFSDLINLLLARKSFGVVQEEIQGRQRQYLEFLPRAERFERRPRNRNYRHTENGVLHYMMHLYLTEGAIPQPFMFYDMEGLNIALAKIFDNGTSSNIESIELPFYVLAGIGHFGIQSAGAPCGWKSLCSPSDPSHAHMPAHKIAGRSCDVAFNSPIRVVIFNITALEIVIPGSVVKIRDIGHDLHTGLENIRALPSLRFITVTCSGIGEIATQTLQYMADIWSVESIEMTQCHLLSENGLRKLLEAVKTLSPGPNLKRMKLVSGLPSFDRYRRSLHPRDLDTDPNSLETDRAASVLGLSSSATTSAYLDYYRREGVALDQPLPDIQDLIHELPSIISKSHFRLHLILELWCVHPLYKCECDAPCEDLDHISTEAITHHQINTNRERENVYEGEHYFSSWKVDAGGWRFPYPIIRD